MRTDLWSALFTVHPQYQAQCLGLKECVLFLSGTLFIGILEVCIEGLFLQRVFSLFLLSAFELSPDWNCFFGGGGGGCYCLGGIS